MQVPKKRTRGDACFGCLPARPPSLTTRDSKYAGDDRRARESRARKGAAHCSGRASPKPSPTATAMPTSQLPTLEFVLRNYKNFNARATRDALLAYLRHIENGGKNILGEEGALASGPPGGPRPPPVPYRPHPRPSPPAGQLQQGPVPPVAHALHKD